jgi:hypothetical protein
MITIEEAKALSKKLLFEEGVSGIGGGSEKIKVYVEDQETAERVPTIIAGFPTEVVVSGRFFKLNQLEVEELPEAKFSLTGIDKKARIRPAPGGVSVGHYLITAGTLTSRVYDRKTGRKLFLSNNHVLAASNRGKIGDPILQPGSYDGGIDPRDRIGVLERFVEIKAPPETNLVDAALGRPIRDEDLSDEVLDIGVIDGVEEAKEGMVVAKSGRTTCYAEALVEDTKATVKVYNYPWGYSIFEDQIITTLLGRPGDSGSCVVRKGTKKAVGLLFAGSLTHTVLNKMTNVCKLLDISFTPRPPVMAGVPILLGLALIPNLYLLWKK